MSQEEQILRFIEMSGPTTPIKVAKNIKTESYLASAHLSHLSSRGKVKISFLKVGSSPLYYLPGQEEQLINFAQDNLNPKDYQVLLRLKEEQILREKELELLTRVALRKIKDFAIPLQVNYHEETEIFWRWYLLPTDDINKRINEILSPKKEPQKEVEEKNSEVSQEAPSKEEVQEEKTPIAQESVQEEEKQQKLPAKDTPNVTKKKKIKVALKTPKKETTAKDKFAAGVQQFLEELDIVIEEEEVVRKNSELDYVLTVPSVIGRMKYYAKAKSKKRCDEKDISAAYMQAQVKKLPLLFIHKGTLTKKAQEMIETGVFENAIIKEMS